LSNQKNTESQQLDALVVKVKKAQKIFANFSQEKVDKIFRAAALAASDARIPLAKQAVLETRMGIVEDKVIKNHFASEYIYNKYKDEATCGILDEDEEFGTMTIASPLAYSAELCPRQTPLQPPF